MKILKIIFKLVVIFFHYGNLTFLDFNADDWRYFPVTKIFVYPKAKRITLYGYDMLDIGEDIPDEERIEY
jgi:hypothetical protein